MSLIEIIIAVQNYFLAIVGVDQIILIRKQNITIDNKFNDIEYIRQSTINGC